MCYYGNQSNHNVQKQARDPQPLPVHTAHTGQHMVCVYVYVCIVFLWGIPFQVFTS